MESSDPDLKHSPG